MHTTYEPLHFVLLFPREKLGWDPKTLHATPNIFDNNGNNNIDNNNDDYNDNNDNNNNDISYYIRSNNNYNNNNNNNSDDKYNYNGNNNNGYYDNLGDYNDIDSSNDNRDIEEGRGATPKRSHRFNMELTHYIFDLDKVYAFTNPSGYSKNISHIYMHELKHEESTI